MVDIQIYNTIEDAEKNLESVLEENKTTLESLKSNLKILASHKSKRKCGDLVSRTEINCLFFLNKEEGRYDFSYGIKSIDEGISELSYETIEELAKAVKESTSEGEIYGKYCSYGLKINPVFYTIREPIVLTADERERVSKILNWEIDNSDVEGLNREEIEKFVSVY